MKNIFVLILTGLIIQIGWAQDNATVNDPGQNNAINLESDNGDTPVDVESVVQEKPIVPMETKIPVVRIPGKLRKDRPRAAMGSAGTSGAPMIKKPVREKVTPDHQKIKAKFAGARLIRRPEKY